MKQNLLFLFLAITPVSAKAQSGSVDMAKIAQAVQKQSDQLQSASAHYIETVNRTRDFDRIFNVKPGGIWESPSQSVQWAFKGEKNYRAVSDKPGARDPKAKDLLSMDDVGVFDGKHQYDSQVVRNPGNAGMVNVNYRKQRTNFVSPLSFGYQVYTKGLNEVMRNPSTKAEGTLFDPKFGLLFKFSTSIETPKESKPMLFWLAPRLGYLAVRVEDAAPTEGRDFGVSQLVEAKQYGSFWFPIRGSDSAYRIENGKPVLLIERTLAITKVTFNDAPDSTFKPLYTNWPGAVVRDDDSNITWEIDAHGERVVINQPDNTAMWLGWLFVGSLTVLLAAGMRIIWRRKQRQSFAKPA